MGPTLLPSSARPTSSEGLVLCDKATSQPPLHQLSSWKHALVSLLVLENNLFLSSFHFFLAFLSPNRAGRIIRDFDLFFNLM